MKLQKFEMKNKKIREEFLKLKGKINFEKKLKLSWSNWGFGLEDIETTLKRLKNNNLEYIELHGNRYGEDLGYDSNVINSLLLKYSMKVSGVCGMFSKSNDLSSNNPFEQQQALNYLKRQIELTSKVGGEYLLVVPGAVGRPVAYDSSEIERSIKTLKKVALLFEKYSVKGAIEPIRAAETSIIHTVKEAKEYIKILDENSISYINGDVYHMLSGEEHIGEAILEAGDKLINLHMADSNRLALGRGSLDLDTIIMALYLIRYNEENKFITFEPLGPGSNPYFAMNCKHNPKDLDKLVEESVKYFRQREEEVLKLLR